MNLYSQISSCHSLIQGFGHVCESDGAPGSDGVTIDQFNELLENNVNALNYELKYNCYKPLPLIMFEKKKASGKARRLFIFAVRDRVAQASAMLALSPLFENELEKESFAYRRGFSREAAARRIYSLFNEGYIWALDADISNFFDKVSHQILLQRLKDLVAEEKVIELIKKWLNAEYLFNNHKHKIKEGLPQGCLISPMLANLYLDKFDEAVKERGYKLVRYADDFLILTKTKPEAEQALYLTADILKEHELQLNFEKTRITNFNSGFKYLGYIFLNSLIIPSSSKDTSFPMPVTEPDDVINKVREKFSDKNISLKKAGNSYEDRLKSSVAGEAFIKALEQKGLSVTDFLMSLENETKLVTEKPAGSTIKAEQEVEDALLKDGEQETAEFEEPASPSPVFNTSAFGRTLYIQEQGSVLLKDGERIIVQKSGTELLDIPALKVNQVIIFGNCTLTPAALQFFLRKSVPVILLSSRGKYYGRVESTVINNAEYERLQIIRSIDTAFSFQFAKQVVITKLNNSKVFLQRHNKRKPCDITETAIETLNKLLRMAERANNLEILRGIEGSAASAYFKAFGTLFISSTGFYNESFLRTKRPPLDPINSMLSFGYTLFHANIISMIRAHGLNPYVGFYHQLRAGHPALASDLQEEFRCVTDSMVVNIINQKILTRKDFYTAKEPSAPCYLTSNGRKEFIRQFELKINSKITHPETKLKADYRRCIQLQVQQLLKTITGEAENYIPFRIKL